MPDEDTKTAYRQAYEDWQTKLAELHKLLLDGERIPPIQIKGLLNRESRAKRNYDRARLALLGIESEEDPGDEEDE
ncbi:MAG: hypothetical protein AB7P33_17405 [Dehalococcoidia bacterium]